MVIVNSAVSVGLGAQSIRVEVNVEEGPKSCRLLGLSEHGAIESMVRVRAALDNSGFPFPTGSVRITLTPELREGSPLDLAIALGLLAAQGVISSEALGETIVFGELAMDGAVRVSRGALVVSLHAARSGCCRLLYPWDCRGEVRLGPAPAALLGVSSLQQAVSILRGELAPPRPQARAAPPERTVLDLADIAGLEVPKRALEVAAAGGHNILFIGPPGTSKTMLARRLPGLLPPLQTAAALETTAIYSAGGLLGRGNWDVSLMDRPFRAPHHSISLAGLQGGGAVARPGELSLAHHGVLLLEDLPEFKRPALELVRRTLEQRKVTVAQGRQVVDYPADFLLVGAMLPCPCGREDCTCSDESKLLYRERISAVAQAFDLVVRVPQISVRTLLGSGGAVTSAEVRDRVVEARARQRVRQGCQTEWGRACDMQRVTEAQQRLGVRGTHAETLRRLRVARTIADLAGTDVVQDKHAEEAFSLA